MTSLSDLHAEGVTDLYSYNKGVEDATANIIKLLERLWEKTQGTDLPAVVILPEAIALIKEENK